MNPTDESTPTTPDLFPFDAAGVRLRIGDFVRLSPTSSRTLRIKSIMLDRNNKFLVDCRLYGEDAD